MIFRLAWNSLRSRSTSSILTVLAIALSVFLLLSVERVRQTTEDSFTQSVSQVDLIVGARTGPTALILFTVFNIGNPTQNVSYASYLKWKNNPAVDWSIPYSLGDGHRGYRVVGTTPEFFEHYRFRGDGKVEFEKGQIFSNLRDVVVGSEVAEVLNYKVGDEIVVAHGVTHEEGVVHHKEHPFKISGILKSTGTPIDRSLYVSLLAMESLHAPAGHEVTEKDIDAISAFFLRTKSRIETLQLQREINDDKSEPLLAIIPGVTLAELWHSLSYVDKVLKVISVLVILVGFFVMLVALLTSLNERRREMAVLRAIGARPQHIFLLLVVESGILTGLGILSGFFTVVLIQGILGGWISHKTGLFIKGFNLSTSEFVYLSVIFVSGTLLGCFPALQAFKSSLKDGLSVRI
jgi:putative ABC transport system permease protein